jgi:hypothetical protein
MRRTLRRQNDACHLEMSTASKTHTAANKSRRRVCHEWHSSENVLCVRAFFESSSRRAWHACCSLRRMVREALAPYVNGGNVCLPGAMWLFGSTVA